MDTLDDVAAIAAAALAELGGQDLDVAFAGSDGETVGGFYGTLRAADPVDEQGEVIALEFSVIGSDRPVGGVTLRAGAEAEWRDIERHTSSGRPLPSIARELVIDVGDGLEASLSVL